MKCSIKKILTNKELALVLNLVGFSLLRGLWVIIPQFSLLILASYMMVLCLCVGLSSVDIHKILLLIGAVFLSLLMEYLFRTTPYLFEHLYLFMIYGAIPIYLVSKIKKADEVLRFYAYASLVLFFLYFRAPFQKTLIFSNYMDFGFNFGIPTYLGIHVGRTYLKKKWFLIFEGILIGILLVFANRSVMLTIILVNGFSFFREKNVSKKMGLFLFFGLIGGMGIFYLKELTINLVIFLESHHYSSYAMRQLLNLVQTGNRVSFFSGRFGLWQDALAMFRLNPIFGQGTGAFYMRYGKDTHNLIFDLAVQYGGVGVVLFFILVGVATVGVIKSKQESEKVLGCLFLCMWFPKLFLSSSLFKESGIWLYIAYGIMLKMRYSKTQSEGS